MDEVECTGGEDRLDQCTFPGYGVVNCPSNLVVELTCQRDDPDPMPNQGDLRFSVVRADSNAQRIRGLVEIFNDGLWGRVCDDNFDVFDASVACRQLGYSSIGMYAGTHCTIIPNPFLTNIFFLQTPMPYPILVWT